MANELQDQYVNVARTLDEPTKGFEKSIPQPVLFSFFSFCATSTTSSQLHHKVLEGDLPNCDGLAMSTQKCSRRGSTTPDPLL